MKKILIGFLVLSLTATMLIAFGGCKKGNVNYEQYDPSKYTESIDLSGYTLVFSDEFDGALDRDLWGDTRQGTRRDGFWTKNLAYTDGEGHLVIRTQKSGSRWCCDPKERQVTGTDGTRITLKYDDCFPFAMIAGDFGSVAELHRHTDALVGFDILAKFDTLASSFATFMSKIDLPSDGAIGNP